MNKISNASRILLALGSLAILATYVLPIWRIDLFAPQYPEGLTMKIWLDHLTGDVEIINGLNHYIGMAHIKEEMFPEFGFLKYIAAFFIAFGLLTAFLAYRKMVWAFFSLMCVGAVLALYDFYQWGYKYGHELDPTAPIQVPGLSYQPPVIGYKLLLNFEAWSVPDLGGWIFIGLGILTFLILLFESFILPRQRAAAEAALFALPLMMLFSGCSAQPEAIRYGKDACHFCKMTIMDVHFGAETVTKKGKVFKFDDLNCLVNSLKMEQIKAEEMEFLLVADYAKPETLIDAKTALYVDNEKLKTPMAAGIAAFQNQADESVFIKEKGGERMDWTGVNQKFE